MTAKEKAPMKRRLMWYGVLALAMLGGIGAMVAQQSDAPPDPKQQQDFSDLQIAVALARDVRDSLKNPPSFDLVNAVIQGDGSVCMVYRATNSFGGVVTAQAVRPSRGTTYWTSDSDRAAFKKQWSAACSKPGRDEARMVKRMM